MIKKSFDKKKWKKQDFDKKITKYKKVFSREKKISIEKKSILKKIETSKKSKLQKNWNFKKIEISKKSKLQKKLKLWLKLFYQGNHYLWSVGYWESVKKNYVLYIIRVLYEFSSYNLPLRKLRNILKMP